MKKKKIEVVAIAVVNKKRVIIEKINNFFVIVIKLKGNHIGLTNFSRTKCKKSWFLL